MAVHSHAASLTATLRSGDDEALASLLRQRPDLAVPPPANLDGLATRARTALSVSRALDMLDEFTLRVLDGLRLVGTEDETGPLTSLTELATVATQPGVNAAVERLRELALIWGPDERLRYPATLSEAAGPYPAGLGRPAAELGPEAEALVADAAALRRGVLAASPQSRAVLDRLAAGPPVGNVADAYADAPSDSPVRWLIAHHLLVPVAEDTVELPREVGVLLRRESGPLGQLRDEPAPVKRLDSEAVNSSGAAQVVEVVRLTAALLDAMAEAPVPEVKAGGIGTQSLRRLAREADLSDLHAGLLLEAAYGAGLLGQENGEWLPSLGFDSWRTSSVAQRWAGLARAWRDTARDVRLLGARAARSRPAGPLSDGLFSRAAPRHRQEVLRLFGEHGPGTVLESELVIDILGWRHPRRRFDDTTRAILEQASFLGIIARDALTKPGRELFAAPKPEDPLGLNADDGDQLIMLLDDVLPAPVDEIIIQNDLSVIVPGHPSTLLTAELPMVTEQESATVHRVTETSLRVALDAGYTADDIRGVFTRRSTGPLPQALSYLIDDVARRHGGLRAGHAGSYLRSEDEVLVAEALNDRRLADAELLRLASTVLVSPLPLSVLLETLRRNGYKPVAEDASGSVVIDRSTARRAVVPSRPEPAEDPTPHVDGAPLFGLVYRLRNATGNGLSELDEDTAEATEVLREAVPERSLVWVEYTDRRGETVRRLLRPVSLASGYLRAEDRRTDMLHTIAVQSIVSVTLASV